MGENKKRIRKTENRKEDWRRKRKKGGFRKEFERITRKNGKM